MELISEKIDSTAKDFQLFKITLSRGKRRSLALQELSVEVIINPTKGSIDISPANGRGHLMMNDWIFDNTRDDVEAVAIIAGLSVLLGE